MNQSIDISTSTIFRFILIVLGLVFLYLIRDVLFILFVAVIIAAAIDGPVDWLAKHKVRRVLGTAIIYILIFSLLTMFIYLVLPSLATQLKVLAENLPEILNRLGTGVAVIQQRIGYNNIQKIIQQLSGQISGAAGSVVGTAVNIFGGIFSAAVILVISVYLVIQDKDIKNFFAGVTSKKHQAYVASLTERIQAKLGAWLRGQLILMLIMGFLFYIGLVLLKVKFALTLALIGALFEIVPYIGPILAGIVAVVMSFAQSPLLALLVLLFYIVVHQLEGNIIAPQVMKRVVGLNPLIVIISMIIGGKLAGILGVVVAVPIAAAISVFLSDVFLREENK